MTIIDDESLPSKELLEAVLGYPKMVETNVPYIINIIGKPYLFTDNTENIWFNTDNVGLGVCKINKYAFAIKCKSYVVKNSGWTLQSYTNERDAGICRVKVGDGQEINKFIASSEVQAIFKATEWVYTELKNKGN